MNIIPAILPKNRDELIAGLQRLIEAKYSGRIQIDLCDGVFVQSITYPFDQKNDEQDMFDVVQEIENDTELQGLLKNFFIDIDIMTEYSSGIFLLCEALHAGRIIIHLDSVDTEYFKESVSLWLAPDDGPHDFLHRDVTMIAISHQSDLSEFAYYYEKLGIRNIQVMGIETIGKQGELFSEKTITIIEQLQKKYPDLIISVDGGVNQQTIPKLAKLGIDSVVAGSAVFNGDISDNIQSLQKSAII